jgi:hypothetical protein
MSQEMGPLEVRVESGPPQGAANNRADGTGIAKTAMRCLVPDENAACCAARPILPQVGRDRFSDITRKRKAIVVTSLATHRKHSGPPIDIVEFQGDDLTCTQPQAGQEQKDCVITAADRGAPITSLDDPLDLVLLNVPGQLGMSPGWHGRNGRRQVAIDLPLSEEKPEEGAKCCYHQLGNSGTAGTGMTEQKTRDVIRAEFAKTNMFFPKTLNEETSEEIPIPADRYRSKAPFLPEIGFILLLKHSQRGSIYRQLCRLNDALGT